MGRIASVVDTVEALYFELSREDPRSWLERVLRHVECCVPDATGGFAYAYDIAGPAQSWRISFPVVHRAPSAMATHIFDAFTGTSPDARAQVIPRLGSTGTFSAVTGQTLTMYGPRQAARFRAMDAVHVNGLDADSRGVLVAITIPEPRRLRPAEARRLRLLSAHLTAAYRLWISPNRHPVAVFDRRGRAAHVERGHEPALATLRQHVLSITARQQAKAQPEEVLEAWQALVLGRYSLVARFDSDGRRFLVAMENAPTVLDPRGLTRSEAAVSAFARHGHSLKQIGYELGLSTGTVSGLLARAFRKLRVRTRTELIQRLTEPTRLVRLDLGRERLLVFSEDRPQVSGVDLTAAEQDVADRLLAGQPNALIALHRGTSLRTVGNQVASVFRKAGVSSRVELAAKMRRAVSP